MSILVYQIKDPFTRTAKINILRAVEAKREVDGSLDLSRCGFGDAAYLVCREHDAYVLDVIISHRIPAHELPWCLEYVDSTPVLALIRKSDYESLMEQRKRVRQWQGALREEMSNLPRESPWPIPTRRILVRQIRDEDAPYEGDNIIHSWEVDLDLFDGSLDLSELALDIEEDYVVKCPNPPQYWYVGGFGPLSYPFHMRRTKELVPNDEVQNYLDDVEGIPFPVMTIACA